MTEFNLRGYVAKETAIGVVINSLVATVPSLLFANPSIGAIFRPVREVAVSLTPQFFMAAFMSALVPMLLICRKQARGRWSISTPRLRPGRAVVIAVGLATASTILTLALIHILVAPLAVRGMGAGAILMLSGAQAALAAAAVTPVAILLLLGVET